MLTNNLMPNSGRLFECLVEVVFLPVFRSVHRELNLRQPIYQSTSCYGHFGRAGFTWEEAKTLNLDCLKELAAATATTNGNGEHADKKARYA